MPCAPRAPRVRARTAAVGMGRRFFPRQRNGCNGLERQFGAGLERCLRREPPRLQRAPQGRH